jgi:hypothetical protein
MANFLIGAPIYSDVGVLEAPAFDASGQWNPSLPLTNLQDRRLWRATRSASADPAKSRLALDLKRDRQIRVIAFPKHNLVQRPRVLVDWKAGDALPTGYVFTRAGVARYIDANGVLQSAASGVLRDGHYHNGRRGLLLEPGSENLCLQASDFGASWAAIGTPTRSAAAHTASGVTLDLLGDDDGAALEGYSQTIVFTGNGLKAIAVHAKLGSSTSSVIVLRDTTAGADRLLGVLTWDGTTPVVTMTTGTYRGFEILADGVYRLLFTTASVTAANTNSLRAYPATTSALVTTNTGTVYFGGVQAENGAYPTSHIPTTTTTASRVADSLYLPFAYAPTAMRVEVEQVNVGNFDGNVHRFVHIGTSTPSANPRFACVGTGTDGYPQTVYNNGVASSVTATRAPAPLAGVRVRSVHTISASGAVTVEASYDGGLSLSTTSTTEAALPSAWADTKLHLAGLTSETPQSHLISLRVLTTPSTNAKWRVAGRSSATLFGYHAGDDLAARGVSFARASVGTYVDRFSRIRTAAAGVVRDDHWINGERTLLIERAATQLVASPESPSGFVSFATPVITTGQVGPFGATAILIEDDDAGGREGKQATPTFPVDGTQTAMFCVRKGTAARIVLGIRDTTAGNVDRHTVQVTWGAAETDTPTLGTENGSGTIFAPYAVKDSSGNTWWMISFSATGVVAANTNICMAIVQTFGSGLGTFYLAGINAWNSAVPFSWQSAAATRAADALSFPVPGLTPRAMTAYIRGRELGTYFADGVNRRTLHIGSADPAADPRLSMGKGSAGLPFAQYDDGVTDVSSQVAFSPAAVLGDLVEHRITLTSAWTVISGTSLNGATEQVATASSASASVANFLSATIHLTGGLTSNSGSFAYTHIFIANDTKTVSEMRAVHYDSGWLDAWPTGLSAEDLQNLNYALVHVLPTTAPACRRWSVQFHDPENADLYVELARLVIAGGYQTTTNPMPGYTAGAESATSRVETDGGAAQFDVRPMRRTIQAKMMNLPENEAWTQAWRTMKQLGPAGQCFVVPDPDAVAGIMAETAFLAVPRELMALEYGETTVRSPSFAFVEEI